ncbi:50S ribosomal protein L21e [archaeon]|nr:50S ribosomal protein L21e [archaeon]
MVTSSHGSRKGTRYKLRKKKRDKGKIAIRKLVQEFKKGDSVIIKPEPSIQKGMPHKRFFWKKGKVTDKRGKSYVIELRTGKKVISSPVHLKGVE